MIRFDLLTRRPAAMTAHDLERIAAAMTRILRLRGRVSVSVSFVSEAAIRKLNREHMGKDRPTDVLSFPLAAFYTPPKEARLLGDVVICPAYAEREARRRSIPAREELARLLIHGILHLVGYDHATPAEEARMFGLQERVVEAVTRV
ncbi:MAG TPA: rRNA maturation RNase YbeY [Verrucomicrobiae bacterium]|nr:rRNA maturation RNase YbeY [Verrucomicrobiae bacterium]